ncbi:hypothetical protein QBC46DRAFT_422431 [Diplogelasinospora grovesii]|uniref:EGF-like domain-containing protein n=1 Tax=Diplogelasinospora grovesii TaxID=303347 RepID=A0AAN6S7S2_9PEZI|nr:hypothetical protein QBC46DRAFT_422431 [Diplogelasinospora grovesii]
MSSRDGRDMDQPSGLGSVRRARERAEAGLPLEDSSSTPRTMPAFVEEAPQIAQPSMPRRPPAVGATAGQLRNPRPQAPPGLHTKDGQIGVAISRPTPVPQWPLQGPLPATSADSEPYRPPPGKSQPPQRPPRPSRVPSILDASKVQDPTPSFSYRPQSGRDSSSGQDLLSVPETPSSMSRPSTLSSVGSIPDFPLPVQLPVGPPRRSVTLGPPPSARRGASSFYSNASYVSPIPEESPRSRSHTSFASSAAMPDGWGTPSPGPSPNYPGAFYDDAIVEEPSVYGDEDAEESRLVRSASIGKRAKPTLVSATTPRGVEAEASSQRPGPAPVQTGPFKDGTGYIENSSSSSALPTAARLPLGTAVTADAMLNAYSSASATDPSNPSVRGTPSPQPPPGGRPYSRLSAIRRPPRLDIDAVRKAESRGSLTSLPDLIRRATRLAASLEKGRRPASRFDDLSDFPDAELYGDGTLEKEISVDGGRHQSGLSDMLAAFPPPAQAVTNSSRRSFRDSIREQVQSWPLPLNLNRTQNASQEEMSMSRPPTQQSATKGRRRCCGLPLWAFILVMIVILILVAAAIVLPLEFFVIRKGQNTKTAAQTALEQCQAQVSCANNGTNVVNQGFCSCICTNGFTGFDCTVAGTTGCTMTSLTGDNTINNVTIGDAIPRLIAQAETNFSIPLSGTAILAKLNAGNLSCSAENALVTFDGQDTRQGDASAEVIDPSSGSLNVANVVNGVAFTTITIMVGEHTTITLEAPLVTPATAASAQLGAGTGFSTIITAPTTFSTIFATTISFGATVTFPGASTSRSPSPSTTSSPSPSTTSTITTTMSMSSSSTAPSATGTTAAAFTVTEQVLDFARVAVLFILQEETLDNAKTAQATLQRFFSSASPGSSLSPDGVSIDAARNVTLGNGNSVDLVRFTVKTPGSNSVVGGTGTTAVEARDAPGEFVLHGRRTAFSYYDR